MPDGADDEVVPSDEPATGPSAGPSTGPSTSQAADPTTAGKHERKKPDRFWRELPILLLVSLAVAILIKTFLIQAFYIPSISMEPTLEKGDRILVCRICVHVGDIRRGDIIVFSNPHPASVRGPRASSVRRCIGSGRGSVSRSPRTRTT